MFSEVFIQRKKQIFPQLKEQLDHHSVASQLQLLACTPIMRLYLNEWVCVLCLQVYGSLAAEGCYGGTRGLSAKGEGELGRGNSQERSYAGGEPQFERRDKQVRKTWLQDTYTNPFSKLRWKIYAEYVLPSAGWSRLTSKSFCLYTDLNDHDSGNVNIFYIYKYI